MRTNVRHHVRRTKSGRFTTVKHHTRKLHGHHMRYGGTRVIPARSGHGSYGVGYFGKDGYEHVKYFASEAAAQRFAQSVQGTVMKKSPDVDFTTEVKTDAKKVWTWGRTKYDAYRQKKRMDAENARREKIFGIKKRREEEVKEKAAQPKEEDVMG